MFRTLSFVLMILIGANIYAPDIKAASITEQQKIDALLDDVKYVTAFIRNGEAHDGACAYKHLKEKLDETKDVKTAEDFITKVASVSRETGTPYVIKYDSPCMNPYCKGLVMESNKWFHQRLAEIEQRNKP